MSIPLQIPGNHYKVFGYLKQDKALHLEMALLKTALGSLDKQPNKGTQSMLGNSPSKTQLLSGVIGR